MKVAAAVRAAAVTSCDEVLVPGSNTVRTQTDNICHLMDPHCPPRQALLSSRISMHTDDVKLT